MCACVCVCQIRWRRSNETINTFKYVIRGDKWNGMVNIDSHWWPRYDRVARVGTAPSLLRFGVVDARVFIFKRRLLRPKPIFPRYVSHKGVYNIHMQHIYLCTYRDSYIHSVFWVAAKRARNISLSRLAAGLIFFVFVFCGLACATFCVCPSTVLPHCIGAFVWGLKRNPIRSCQWKSL